MRPDAKVEKVYLYPKPVDFRKSIDGLAALVELDIKVAVFDPVLFVFLNRHRNRVKILYWERNGFCLWLKRLESERFKTLPCNGKLTFYLVRLGNVFRKPILSRVRNTCTWRPSCLLYRPAHPPKNHLQLHPQNRRCHSRVLPPLPRLRLILLQRHRHSGHPDIRFHRPSHRLIALPDRLGSDGLYRSRQAAELGEPRPPSADRPLAPARVCHG
ncbi:ISPsy5, Orf1 [Pseudomonas syringae pv. actinidiae ICMP 19071]|nr:ISPsy5, Orf1 [Pseudomonas syringae pv. actinidiae ICMP 19071]